jgi:hypothetical protein
MVASTAGTLSAGAIGIGLKAGHCAEILEQGPDLDFFEIHAENYMGAGGAPHRQLEAICARYSLSLHGIGLNIGGAAPIDRAHLERLKAVERRYRPAMVSEHLAWTAGENGYLGDLLPIPYEPATLAAVAGRVDMVQDQLGRQILIENPATYVRYRSSSIAETDFLAELARRTGCGLLLDLNNVHVSATNHGFDAMAYVAAFPLALVGEIHLAGCAEIAAKTEGGDGGRLLIDTHDRAPAPECWELYRQVLRATGPSPTLIEWDNDVPALPVLLAEAAQARQFIDGAQAPARYLGAA